MSQSPIHIFEKRSATIPHVWIAAGTTTVAVLLDIWAIAFNRPLLFGLLPVTVGSLSLLLSAGLRLARSNVPAIVLSPEGLLVRSFADQTIPWQAVRTATLFTPIRSKGPNLAIVFDSGRILQWSTHATSASSPDRLYEITLKMADYDTDPKLLEQGISERIVAATAQPWSGEVTRVRLRGNHYANAFVALAFAGFLLVIFASMIVTLHNNRLLAQILAPHYPPRVESQHAFAQSNIKAYPRDTRVRLGYAEILAETGRWGDAQAELIGALADKGALSAIDDYLCRGRSACSFRPHIEDRIYMLLAVVLAKQHKIGAAKAAMAGLCHYAKDGDMPMLIKLDLCHYE